MKIQWLGENIAAIEAALHHHECRVFVEDGGRKTLSIVGVMGLNVTLNLGDTLEINLGLDGVFDSIGVHRIPVGDDGDPEVMWTGENAFAVKAFVQQHDTRVEVRGPDLLLHTEGDSVVRLRRGDKLIRRGGRYLFMSRAGKEHRA